MSDDSELQKALNDKFICIKVEDELVDSGGISTDIESYYYMTPEAIDEEGAWVLYSFWWDDNFIKWQFNEVGVERGGSWRAPGNA